MAYALGGAAVFLVGNLLWELLEEMEQESADGIDHAANICRTTAEVNSALDDMLAYLKRRSACNIQ